MLVCGGGILCAAICVIRPWASARVQAAVHSPSDTIPCQGAKCPYERATERLDTLTRRTASGVIVLVYGRRVDTGMLTANFTSILVSGMSVKWEGSRCDLQRRAIPWLRHDMKFPLYRLATLWQSGLTTMGNALAHRHDAERATCLKRSRHGREGKRVRERISSMEPHTHARHQSHVNRLVREPDEQMVP